MRLVFQETLRRRVRLSAPLRDQRIHPRYPRALKEQPRRRHETLRRGRKIPPLRPFLSFPLSFRLPPRIRTAPLSWAPPFSSAAELIFFSERSRPFAPAGAALFPP